MRLLRVQDVAVILGFHPKTVRKMIGDDELPAFRIGGEYWVKEEDLIQVLNWAGQFEGISTISTRNFSLVGVDRPRRASREGPEVSGTVQFIRVIW